MTLQNLKKAAVTAAVAGDRLLDLVGEVRGEQLVVVVDGDERAPSAGHRAQLDGVALDLGRRHEGDDLVVPLPSTHVPLTRPRRALRSPSTSPW